MPSEEKLSTVQNMTSDEAGMLSKCSVKSQLYREPLWLERLQGEGGSKG